jgi:hypothetical protein
VELSIHLSTFEKASVIESGPELPKAPTYDGPAKEGFCLQIYSMKIARPNTNRSPDIERCIRVGYREGDVQVITIVRM